jgi:hypothetical protein
MKDDHSRGAPPTSSEITRRTVLGGLAAAALTVPTISHAAGRKRRSTRAELPTAASPHSMFDPRSGLFSPVASMKMPRARHASVLLPDGRVAVLGGFGQQPTGSVEIYDPGTNMWTSGQPLKVPRLDHTAISDGDAVYILGGSGLGQVDFVEYYQPALKPSGA